MGPAPGSALGSGGKPRVTVALLEYKGGTNCGEAKKAPYRRRVGAPATVGLLQGAIQPIKKSIFFFKSINILISLLF
jgi:hypothetical protein